MLAKFSATQQKHTLNCLQHLKCTSEIICIFFVLFTNSKIQVYSRSRDASFRLTTCTYEVRERTECQMQLGVVGWLAGWLDGWMDGCAQIPQGAQRLETVRYTNSTVYDRCICVLRCYVTLHYVTRPYRN